MHLCNLINQKLDDVNNIVSGKGLWWRAQVEATQTQNRRFPQKAVSDQRGETGCLEAWGQSQHVHNEPPFLLV